jgi:hypothetical protein
MQMPIRAFYEFYYQATKMEALEFREHLDISMASTRNELYYKFLHEKYDRIIYDKIAKLPEKPPSMCLDAASEDAKNVIFGVFRALKRGSGYG